jgi:hypothetical protein
MPENQKRSDTDRTLMKNIAGAAIGRVIGDLLSRLLEVLAS